MGIRRMNSAHERTVGDIFKAGYIPPQHRSEKLAKEIPAWANDLVVKMEEFQSRVISRTHYTKGELALAMSIAFELRQYIDSRLGPLPEVDKADEAPAVPPVDEKPKRGPGRPRKEKAQDGDEGK